MRWSILFGLLLVVSVAHAAVVIQNKDLNIYNGGLILDSSTVKTSFIPSSNGLALGSSSNRWYLYATDIACSSTSCISLGTETAGNYVAAISAGNGISVTNGSGEGVTPVITAKIGTGLAFDGSGNIELNTTYTDSRYVNEGQANSITSSMIVDGTITNADISNSTVYVNVQNSSGTTQFSVTDGSPGLQFANGGAISVTFDSANHRVTISHANTSTQSSVNNSDGNVIQDINLDTYGHVTSITSVDLDPRFVNVTGDTMTGTLTIQGGLTLSGLANPCTYLYTDSSGNVQCGSGSLGSIDFSGTTNYVAKWISPTTLGNSQIYDNGTNVGIGTTSPSYKLDVSGSARVSDLVCTDCISLKTETAGNYVAGISGGNGISVTNGSGEGVTPVITAKIGTGLAFDTSGNIYVRYGSTAGTAVQGNTQITISAVSGLTGGGTITLGAGGTVTISHADTSSQSSVNNSGGTVIQDVTLDTYGHVTGLASVNLDSRYVNEGQANSITSSMIVDGTITNADISNSTVYVNVQNSSGTTQFSVTDGSPGLQFANGGAISVTFDSANHRVTISHADTSTQSSVNNSGGTVIQDVTLDTYGHVTGVSSYNLDNRYYTESEADSRFVNVTGDTMTGTLTIQGGLTLSGLANPCTYLYTDSSGNVQCGSGSLGSIDFSGTTNYVAKWTGSTTLGNSQIYDNGTNVGIGTTSPSYKLDVVGDIRATGQLIAGDLVFKNDFRVIEDGDGALLLLNPDGDPIMRIDAKGNIWIKGKVRRWN